VANLGNDYPNDGRGPDDSGAASAANCCTTDRRPGRAGRLAAAILNRARLNPQAEPPNTSAPTALAAPTYDPSGRTRKPSDK